jgi:hypothetical protein
MNPRIFMYEMDHSEPGDAAFAAFGRAFAIAARFESGCKALATLFRVKAERSDLVTDAGIEVLAAALQTATLQSTLAKISSAGALCSLDVYRILSAAKDARNMLAHELAVGLDSLHAQPNACDIMRRNLVRVMPALAMGDALVSLYTSIATDEPFPRSVDTYVQRIVDWVIVPLDEVTG